MDQILKYAEDLFQRQRTRNLADYGTAYIPFSGDADAWAQYTNEGYLDKVLNIPYEYFLTLEECESSGDGSYRLSTYSPCPLPIPQKLNLIRSSREDSNLHRHDYHEIIYVYQGHRTMQIENRAVVLQEHDLCIFDTQCAHLDVRSESDGIAFYCCLKTKNLDTYFLSRLDDRKIRDFFLVKGKLRSDVSYLLLHADAAAAAEVNRCIAAIFREMEEILTGYDRITQVYTLRMLNSFQQSRDTDLHTFSKRLRGAKLFQAVAKYINSNIAVINLDMLCEQFHYQSDYYSRLIKKNTGLTYSEYVHAMKMDKARNLLVNTDMTVNDILIFLGYQSPSYFYDSFKKETGMSPLRYRERYRGDSPGK